MMTETLFYAPSYSYTYHAWDKKSYLYSFAWFLLLRQNEPLLYMCTHMH